MTERLDEKDGATFPVSRNGVSGSRPGANAGERASGGRVMMRTMGRTSVVIGASSLATLLSVLFLWQETALVLALLASIHVLTLLVLRDKRYTAVYAIAFILGPAAEAACIYAGAWSYTAPHVIGIPLWLPLVWGAAGILFAKLSDTLHGRKY